MTDQALPELWHFHHSHFNEKARWALDYRGIAHTRKALLPGPHAPAVKRLTGSTEVPVLVYGQHVVPGSAAIIDYLEQHFSGPSLYPEDPQERAAALDFQHWMDAEVGAPARCAYFCDVLPDQALMGRMFSWRKEGVAGALYQKSFPAVHQLLKRVYALTPEHAEAGRQRITEALDRIADETRETGYLVGGQFTVADLTAAGLLMFCAWPPEYHIPRPAELPPGNQAFLERWQSHPATQWIRRMYAEHRGTSAEVTA